MKKTTVTTAMLLLAWATSAAAGALDECLTAGDHAAVTRCLVEADAQAQASPGANAALAKTLRAFSDYRTLQCDYIRALYASGGGAEQAGLGCRVDLTRRRVRELQP